jgi:hypothetical protein
LVDIKGAWFYVTAGHILKNIRAALDAGSTFDVWRLGDQTAGNKFDGIAIPYAFESERWLVVEDANEGLDYAAVPLQDLYCRNLTAGGSVPVGDDAWSDHLIEHDFWALVGIPSETVAYDEESIIKARYVGLPLTTAEQPRLAGPKSRNQFYAKLSDDSTALSDVDGMSGGPIFAMRKIDGVWNYWVIGVQSSWYRSTRTLAICPFSTFRIQIEKLVSGSADLPST